MTWFFLLGTILTLYDGFVFVLLLVWIRRERKGQHLTKERFRLLVVLVGVNLLIVLAARLLVRIPAWRDWLMPQLNGHHPSWTLVPTVWMLSPRLIWYQITKILGLFGLWMMRKQNND